ncbi:hypothetical protein [Methanosarcina sp.]|uniref:hypothetical protein n=1 Tax=Methanosarcina sp. TaxID=2213 RepID=UPI003C73F030
MLDWIYNNREWLFDGAGILIISFFLKKILFKESEQSSGTERIKQIQKSGKNSTNIQSGHDMTINLSRENKR